MQPERDERARWRKWFCPFLPYLSEDRHNWFGPLSGIIPLQSSFRETQAFAFMASAIYCREIVITTSRAALPLGTWIAPPSSLRSAPTE